MTRPSALALVAFAFSALGCTVTAVGPQDDRRPTNTCESDSECSTGSCGSGVCQALNGQLEALLISVSPPSDSKLPHFTFVTHVADVPTSGGTKNIELSESAHLSGTLVVNEKSGCYPTFVSSDPSKTIPAQDGKSLPVAVSFELRQGLLGVPQQSYVTESQYGTMTGAHAFDMRVPAGEYDVYFVPPTTLPDCPLPPQLRRGWTVQGGDFAVAFPVAPVSRLKVFVRWPKVNDSLAGWLVDMIEPLGGKPISTEAVLGVPTEGPVTVEYEVELAYSEVLESEAAALPIDVGGDLVRLRPPVGVVAPTIFLDRAALGLFNEAKATIKDLTQLPKAVTVEGQLARADTGAPVQAAVLLTSTQISGVDSGIFASFQTTLNVGADGVFRVELPPGKYDVQAMPPVVIGGESALDMPLAAHKTSWDIPPDIAFQAGKLLELPVLNELTGQSRFRGAQVRAVARPLTVVPFKAAFGAADLLPRAASGLVDDAGHFSLLADPGAFDISLQAPDSLGFGWYVRAGVDVRDPRQDLGRVALSPPIALSGMASVGSAATKVPVASGVVRAYAYLDKDLAYTREPTEAVSVVQVAETRADEQGVFRLLLPSSITAPK